MSPFLRLLMLALPGCGGRTMDDAPTLRGEDEAFAEQMADASEGFGSPAPDNMLGGNFGTKGAAAMAEAIGTRGDASPTAVDDPPPRAWFPESFLFAPQVVTDPQGAATVAVRVPDRLTTWRVLGLAHDMRGQTAGTLHTFDSRLPLSVEAVVPAHLTRGDVIRLPIQAANAT
ncbi:MAG: alpha-2-macroglobulin family protein, partial [Myxococcota bacterium]|nr:alpha-2-macroglobulin family protein [Myxococcota bacterium]